MVRILQYIARLELSPRYPPSIRAASSSCASL